ncbi:MAG: DUF1573 domain-containing protein [Planctomycetia bacterium]|nr:DUF1573 domain-containing protein [Planctomycetia bacterium]
MLVRPRKQRLVIRIAVLMAVAAAAVGAAWRANRSSPVSARQSDSSSSFDLGGTFIDQDPIVRGVVPVSNRATATLQFVRVERTCGCVKASLDRSTLSPGQTCNLQVALDLTGHLGQRTTVARSSLLTERASSVP